MLLAELRRSLPDVGDIGRAGVARMLATSPADECVDDNGTLCAELLDDLWLIGMQQAVGWGGRIGSQTKNNKEKKRKRRKKFFSLQSAVGEASPGVSGKHFSLI